MIGLYLSRCMWRHNWNMTLTRIKLFGIQHYVNMVRAVLSIEIGLPCSEVTSFWMHFIKCVFALKPNLKCWKTFKITFQLVVMLAVLHIKIWHVCFLLPCMWNWSRTRLLSAKKIGQLTVHKLTLNIRQWDALWPGFLSSLALFQTIISGLISPGFHLGSCVLVGF